ncbi:MULTISPECIES: GntR family transcriptional regulator [Comamonas]|uniref:GntR family transcriptional regulator n=1 Tax=Comamonas aquatica TaxID=225991 RepID=A0AA42I3B4_9BURK|nr:MULTISPECIES: GntR family transcriptional regulator [Comamonas]MDH0365235.1 GntR family transcriptional regulator [Comamonas aquatica]MDH0373613.1 GntR family transcriptional regulator [Comamonas aquatica]MDH0496383.1 GntR family transcriptional regulator [Comamonas aquatica]MDH1676406.1 GntR family transcriptional regulator [Comamonas aquatica]MDH1679956.1 GntR family transcriptional regulator [Comamonas aquatica]
MTTGKLKAYDQLKLRLVAGYYQPGTQLKEEPLAEEFGTSRTPIRAALRKLVEDGLATADTGRGIQVAAWTQWDIEEVFQLRLLLEPYAAQLAAERCTPQILERLESSNAKMQEAISSDTPDMATMVQDANRAFHHTLLEASGSQRLINMLGTMIDMPVITRSFQLYSRSDMEQSLHHHRDLTMAVAAKDGDLAKQVMQLHLQMSRHRFMRNRRV